MPDEIKKPVENPNPNPQPSPVDEAQELIELKRQNEELQKKNSELQDAKSKFYDSVLNGRTPNVDEPKLPTAQECREDLRKAIDRGATNLEITQKSVALDDACIRETGQSCFLPINHEKKPTAQDLMDAKTLRKGLDECLEAADGDPTAFNMAMVKNGLK